ncbi:exoprotein ABC transporter permease EscB [Bacillaceae bacterium ZC4]|jgi:ABC-2 type transport system permease protein|uniref:ABC transporter permease n=1 Tax=Aeribacillus sp. FSL M8-0235 TaxID=2954576 RepID=UPI001188D0DE|nr:exoprotein ABC transporter permease EscB [Bacillaceae bacterium ZC4]
MRSINDIWPARLAAHIKETQTYLRYMLNDHLLLVIMFLLGGGAYAYQQWLDQLPPHFPSAFLMALLLALTVTFSQVRTLLKEPDIIFLLPMEKGLNHYFQRAFIYSYILQTVQMIVCLTILAPLYFQSGEGEGINYLFLIFQLTVIKYWNLWIQWKMTHFPERLSQIMDKFVRYAVNFTVIYLAVKESMLSLFIYGMMALVTIYFFKITRNKTLQWEFLILQENRKLQSFYRLANMFTDVPKLKAEAKRRKWMDWILSFIPYKQSNVFLYMFSRSFIRSGDYFGLFIRLLMIGVIVSIFLPLSLVSCIILPAAVLFLTGIQLTSLYKHYDALFIADLYPVPQNIKKKSFLRLLFTILFIELAVLTIVLLTQTNILFVGVQLAINALFAYIFVYMYFSGKFLAR